LVPQLAKELGCSPRRRTHGSRSRAVGQSTPPRSSTPSTPAGRPVAATLAS